MRFGKILQSGFFWVGMVMMFASSSIMAQVQETHEVAFTTVEARWLKEKADELKTPVAIYEYIRNNVEYVPYWGSWGGSINTFSGLRGNDIDIASTLIAMMRSQGIPARYVSGQIRMSADNLLNWLNVDTNAVAMKYLKNAGTPGLYDGGDYILLNHVWAEVLVPFDQYRGVSIGGNAVDCQKTPGQCQWVPLDASYKNLRFIRKNIGSGRVFSSVWGASDYDAYFGAVNNKDDARINKSVINIFEENFLKSIRNGSHKEYTLDDMADKGVIISVHEGLLPATLPYRINTKSITYDTIAQHDTAEPTLAWSRVLKITLYPCEPGRNIAASSTYEISLVDAALDRLVISYNTSNGNLELRRGRSSSTTLDKTWNFGSSVQCKNFAGNPYTVSFGSGSPFWIQINTDDEPGAVLKAAPATKQGVVGGRYLVAAGGESSNWGQVHRAADALLADSTKYTIVYNVNKFLTGQTCNVSSGMGCIPYVDKAGSPVGWDATDEELSKNSSAVQDLQGGLLEVAAAQYFSEIREQFKRIDSLTGGVTPIRRIVGLVKSDLETQYLQDGTAFSIQPTGLVIDMNILFGQPIGRNNTAASPMRAFFLTFVASSLEHEIWQKLTGFDAMSTVRSMQSTENSAKMASYISVKDQNSNVWNMIPKYSNGELKYSLPLCINPFKDQPFGGDPLINVGGCYGSTATDVALSFAVKMGFKSARTAVGDECFETNSVCRAITDNSLINKYDSSIVYNSYKTLKDDKPLAVGAATTATYSDGNHTVYGPSSTVVLLRDIPATGTGYKSQAFINAQYFGTLDNGDADMSITFGIGVNGIK